MWAVVFVVFTSLLDTHASQPQLSPLFCDAQTVPTLDSLASSELPRYAVLWGVSEPGSSTSCLCLCEFPLSRL